MSLPSVFVVGDSISMNYGPHLGKMLAGRFTYARKTGAEPGLRPGLKATADNGGDSSRVLEYLQDRVAGGDFHPDVLVLNCGLHDIRTTRATGAIQVPPEKYRANLEQIVALARKAAKVVVWVTTTHVEDERHNTRMPDTHRHDKDVVQYNQIAAEVMSAAGVRTIDLNAFTRGLAGEVFRDHVHFAENVCQLQAALIAGFIMGM